ncbi:MAG: glutaredoxin family protein [Desulfofustis sp.]
MNFPNVTLYSLTTCIYCAAIKKMLADLNIPHRFKDADLLETTERQELLEELRTINPKCSFPTTRIGEKTVIGFKVQEIKEAIGIRTEVDELHDQLKKVNEPEGYYFNNDKAADQQRPLWLYGLPLQAASRRSSFRRGHNLPLHLP